MYYFTKTICMLLFLIFLLTIPQIILSQQLNITDLDKILKEKIESADHSDVKYIPKKPGHYTAADWRVVIDSTWGEGLPTEKKLEIFDAFYNLVDDEYPSFFHLNVNWDSLYQHYRPEIEAGVSRGRFAGIMCKIASELCDLHTSVNDVVVGSTTLSPGVPLLVTSGYYSILQRFIFDIKNSGFGAGLSPMPDSSLFVYDVTPDHPLGLKVGDIIIGYDGIPWKNIYPELLKAELPFASPGNIGSNPHSAEYFLLTSAGENWHLFDTIDILKYNSNDTLHLPTNLMVDYKSALLTSAQIDVPGVLKPDVDNKHQVSWGIIDGTDIGYIYVWSWSNGSDGSCIPTGDDFRKAIQELTFEQKVSGLIIDSRFNAGGHPSEYAKGLKILFNQDQNIYYEAIRKNPDDHFEMVSGESAGIQSNCHFSSDAYLFDKPIAVLTGPGSVSSGDLMPFQMGYHPMSRIFGLPSNGAFGLRWGHDLSHISNDWFCMYTKSNFAPISDKTNFLTHQIIPAQETVWLDRTDVVSGKDSPVQRALDWIFNLAYAHDVKINEPYLVPESDSLKISAMVENPNKHDIFVKAYITNDTTLIDSLSLTRDILISEKCWDASWLAQKEDYFSISIKTVNPEDSTSRTLPDVAKFTTVGPVRIFDIIYQSPPQKGGFNYAHLILKNYGKDLSTGSLTARISSKDSLIYIPATTLNFNSIAPGDTVRSDKLFQVYISADHSDQPYSLNAKISHNGHNYWVDSIQAPTPINFSENEMPGAFMLAQNYPNPFNPKTVIRYSLPVTSEVDLSIYNMLGQKIATLVSGKQPAGKYKVEWDASEFASGIYFLRMVAGYYVKTNKMVLVR